MQQQKRLLLYAVIAGLVFAFCLTIGLAYQAQHSSTKSSTTNPNTPSRSHQQNDLVKAVPPQEIPSAPTHQGISRWKAALAALWEVIALAFNKKNSPNIPSRSHQQNDRVVPQKVPSAPNSNNEPNTTTPLPSPTHQEDVTRFETAIAELRQLTTSTYDKSGRDALMLACKEEDTLTVNSLLKFLATQPKNFQQSILTRIDINGRNALIYACRSPHNYTIANSLIDTIQRQSNATQKKIVTQQDINRCSALVYACRSFQKDSVATSLLEIIQQQDKPTQKKMLADKDINNCNAHRAAQASGHLQLAEEIQQMYDQLTE